MSAIRVIIADDHPVFLAGLQALLDSMPGLEVVGSASGGQELLDLAERSQFDVAVLDLDMPGIDGATATEEILRLRPDSGILILTMHDDSGSLRRCLQAGARGYILKGSGTGRSGEPSPLSPTETPSSQENSAAPCVPRSPAARSLLTTGSRHENVTSSSSSNAASTTPRSPADCHCP